MIAKKKTTRNLVAGLNISAFIANIELNQ